MATILLAEDEYSVRKTLSILIGMEGHNVICASNGARALSILEDNPDIDLLITDVIMPEVDGRELVTRIAANQDKFDFPIIMISGFVPFKDIVHLLQNGITRFLPKPVEASEFINAISECLNYQEV